VQIFDITRLRRIILCTGMGQTIAANIRLILHKHAFSSIY